MKRREEGAKSPPICSCIADKFGFMVNCCITDGVIRLLLISSAARNCLRAHSR